MTEKRFVIPNQMRVIKDTVTGEEATFYDTEDGLLLKEWLNNLHDKNEQLKQQNKELHCTIEANSQDDYIYCLKKENEQLKQQIQQLQHWNKCLAEKRHQELSYRHYTASKSEKELKELLKPKLFNCSDR